MNRIFFLAFFMAFALPFMAQNRLAKDFFTQMPDSLLPVLTAVNRADCIDFLESRMKAEVTNRFGHKSQMTDLTDLYIALQMTPKSTWQMKLLPLTDSTQVICTVATVCGPACDSHIRFYTTNWEPLPSTKFLSARPNMAQFLQPAPDSTEAYAYQTAYLKADMLLLKADLSATSDSLTFTFTTTDYLSAEDAAQLRPFLRPTLRYVWKEQQFCKEPE